MTLRNDCDFPGVVPEGTAGNPVSKHIGFIRTAQSPNGKDIIAVTNRKCGSTTLLRIVQ